MSPTHVNGRRRPLFVTDAAHRETCDTFHVHAYVHGLPVAQADDVVVDLPPQAYFDEVLAVERKVVPDHRAATRAERQVFADAGILVQQPRHGVNLEAGNNPQRRVAHGEPADLPCCGHVALEMRRRYRQTGRHVVEALVGLIGQQERLRIDFDRQQIPDGVRVFDPVQAVDTNSSGVGV